MAQSFSSCKIVFISLEIRVDYESRIGFTYIIDLHVMQPSTVLSNLLDFGEQVL